MAITGIWTFTITPIDVPTKTASIQAVRDVVDDADPSVVLSTSTHNIISAVLDTQAQKLAALDNIWQQHLDYQAKLTVIAAYIGGLEVMAKENLEAREV